MWIHQACVLLLLAVICEAGPLRRDGPNRIEHRSIAFQNSTTSSPILTGPIVVIPITDGSSESTSSSTIVTVLTSSPTSIQLPASTNFLSSTSLSASLTTSSTSSGSTLSTDSTTTGALTSSQDPSTSEEIQSFHASSTTDISLGLSSPSTISSTFSAQATETDNNTTGSVFLSSFQTLQSSLIPAIPILSEVSSATTISITTNSIFPSTVQISSIPVSTDVSSDDPSSNTVTTTTSYSRVFTPSNTTNLGPTPPTLATESITSSAISMITDTYPPQQFPTILSIPTSSTSAVRPTSNFNTIITIVMSSNLGLTFTVSSLVPTSIGQSSEAFSTIKPNLVSAASISDVPTIISSPVPTDTGISATTYSQNLAEAKGYNNLFAALNETSPCTSDSIACIDDQTANCEPDGTYALMRCKRGSACFALPMNTTEGVFVGCADISSSENILGIPNSLSVTIPTVALPSSTSAPISSSKVPQSVATSLVRSATPSQPSQVDSSSFQLTFTFGPTASVIASSKLQEESSTIPDVVTSTIQQTHTSTAIVFITPSQEPVAISSPTIPVPSKTTAAIESGITTTGPRSGSLITIIPVAVAGDNNGVTVTVTATETETVTTTEKI